MRVKLWVFLIAIVASTACSTRTEPGGDVGFGFDFQLIPRGCTPGFADYPPGEEAFLELAAGHRPLEAPLLGSGWFLSGNNHTDDLFMYLGCRLAGLPPGASYAVDISVQFATDVPAGCGGVGGSPGESVYMKAGAFDGEPSVAVDVDGWYRTNFDKGNQAPGGRHMSTLGTIENTRSCDLIGRVWELKTLTSAPGATAVQVPDSGAIWILAGTDSAFEATTSVYITRISGTLRPI